jgi:sterol desaturase/sphingolipid hydroxylase (fatty acid hydroxylase superfamily)
MASVRNEPHNGAMARRRPGAPDLTVVAVPFYFAAMAAEHRWARRRAAERGPTPGDYERRDTVVSLSMGVASLVIPQLLPRVLGPLTPGRGRYGRILVRVAIGAAALTTVADLTARWADGESRHGEVPATPPARRRIADIAGRSAAAGGAAAVVTGGLVLTTTWAMLTTPERFWRHRLRARPFTGALALILAVAGWDFIYYWNHRFMHESRFMWAVHVVHHSSERLNLSTALRQPVADALATFLPYGVLCLFGITPSMIETARGVNLLYQFWIHTEAIGRIGAAEAVLNTASHHRVHHGSHRRYLDRNHGSILIIWDRVFGTFEPEGERVVYGLTTNIDTFNLGRVAAHEHLAMLRDVARATTWSARLSHVIRGPGWGAEAPVPVLTARSAGPDREA